MLQAAIMETVKEITNINDIVVSLKDGPQTTSYYVAKYNCNVTLRESQSLVALELLRSSIEVYYYGYYYSSKSLFSRTMSEKLNAPIYAKITFWGLLENMKPSLSPRSSSKTPSKLKVISLVSAHLHSS